MNKRTLKLLATQSMEIVTIHIINSHCLCIACSLNISLQHGNHRCTLYTAVSKSPEMHSLNCYKWVNNNQYLLYRNRRFKPQNYTLQFHQSDFNCRVNSLTVWCYDAKSAGLCTTDDKWLTKVNSLCINDNRETHEHHHEAKSNSTRETH